jgi:hypothetical protein
MMLQHVGAAKIGMNGEAAFNLTALILWVSTFSKPHSISCLPYTKAAHP